jgi:hypothetical protein
MENLLKKEALLYLPVERRKAAWAIFDAAMLVPSPALTAREVDHHHALQNIERSALGKLEVQLRRAERRHFRAQRAERGTSGLELLRRVRDTGIARLAEQAVRSEYLAAMAALSEAEAAKYDVWDKAHDTLHAKYKGQMVKEAWAIRRAIRAAK